ELIRFINTKDILLTATKVLTSAAALLSVEGSASENIVIDGGSLAKAMKKIIYVNGATDASVNLRG
ncbi:MAG TPA: hypothetical protein VK666_27890, partial [Chryseolinea sp.]|nr:hypothetical protein [Chryseolinea sp.]